VLFILSQHRYDVATRMVKKKGYLGEIWPDYRFDRNLFNDRNLFKHTPGLHFHLPTTGGPVSANAGQQMTRQPASASPTQAAGDVSVYLKLTAGRRPAEAPGNSCITSRGEGAAVRESRSVVRLCRAAKRRSARVPDHCRR